MKIINADCFEILKNIPDNSVDVGFTSPPYNRKRNDKYENFNDNQIDNYEKFCIDFTDHLLRICRKYVFVNIQPNYYNRKDVYSYIGHYSDSINNIFVWNKTNPLPASGNNITNSYELIICFGKEPIKSNNSYTKNVITTSINCNTIKSHRAIMNLEVAEFFIKNFTNPGMSVIDPFFGMGTTGVACKKFGVHCIGIEKNKEYYEYAIQRVLSNECVRLKEINLKSVDKRNKLF